MLVRFLFSCLSLCLCFEAFASVAYAGEKLDQIDKKCQDCLDNHASSTADMIACQEQAYKDWDARLNREYSRLMKLLRPAAQKSLQVSQVEWLKYRDQEFKAIAAIYDQLEGTMYQPMRVESRVDIVKERAKTLARYRDLLNWANK